MPAAPEGRLGVGLRYVASELLEGDRVRFRAAPLTSVQAIDRSELCVSELEVEDIDVLRDASGLGRLGDHRATLLETPSQHHLGHALFMRGCDLSDDWVLERAGVLPISVEGDPTDR